MPSLAVKPLKSVPSREEFKKLKAWRMPADPKADGRRYIRKATGKQLYRAGIFYTSIPNGIMDMLSPDSFWLFAKILSMPATHRVTRKRLMMDLKHIKRRARDGTERALSPEFITKCLTEIAEVGLSAFIPLVLDDGEAAGQIHVIFAGIDDPVIQQLATRRGHAQRPRKEDIGRSSKNRGAGFFGESSFTRGRKCPPLYQEESNTTVPSGGAFRNRDEACASPGSFSHDPGELSTDTEERAKPAGRARPSPKDYEYLAREDHEWDEVDGANICVFDVATGPDPDIETWDVAEKLPATPVTGWMTGPMPPDVQAVHDKLCAILASQK